MDCRIGLGFQSSSVIFNSPLDREWMDLLPDLQIPASLSCRVQGRVLFGFRCCNHHNFRRDNGLFWSASLGTAGAFVLLLLPIRSAVLPVFSIRTKDQNSNAGYDFQLKESIRCSISSLKKSITGASESLLGDTLKYSAPRRK